MPSRTQRDAARQRGWLGEAAAPLPLWQLCTLRWCMDGVGPSDRSLGARTLGSAQPLCASLLSSGEGARALALGAGPRPPPRQQAGANTLRPCVARSGAACASWGRIGHHAARGSLRRYRRAAFASSASLRGAVPFYAGGFAPPARQLYRWLAWRGALCLCHVRGRAGRAGSATSGGRHCVFNRFPSSLRSFRWVHQLHQTLSATRLVQCTPRTHRGKHGEESVRSEGERRTLGHLGHPGQSRKIQARFQHA